MAGPLTRPGETHGASPVSLIQAVGSGTSPLTTKGDVYTFTTVDARLAVGADGLFLKADSTQATGLIWAAGGGIPTQVTVADTTDSTCFVALFESATGDLAPKTDGGLLYNASTGALTPTTLSMAAATEAQFRATTQRIYSSAASTLDLDAATATNFRIGGTTYFSVLAGEWNMLNGVLFSWGNAAVAFTGDSATGDLYINAPETHLQNIKILDSGLNHEYIVAPSNLAADRTVTLPLLTGDDTFVFEAHTQTLTNKSIVATQLTGTVPTARLGSGTADATTFLRGDSTWAAAGGSLTAHDHTSGGDGGVLTGDIHDSYLEIIEVATPSNPAADRGRLFTRANGSNIELVFLSSQGIECIICSEPDNSVTAELQLNWVE